MLDSSFQRLKEQLDTLFRLFRNSGKSWSFYQLVASRLTLTALRFTKCWIKGFQARILTALKNFLQNFVATILFAENVNEKGSGRNIVLTKEIYTRIVDFLKKRLKVEFVVMAGLYLKVLHETSHLCYTKA